MFNFLQRTPKASPAIVIEPSSADQNLTPPDTENSNGNSTGHAATDANRSGTFDGKTSADFTPRPGIFGESAARTALAAVVKAKPRTIMFVAAPRTQGHTRAILALLTEQANDLPPSDAFAAVSSVDDRLSIAILRLSATAAKSLTDAVAEAVEMLSVTLPAAFDSDSYKVARLSLDEELRSGHDTAIDNLKRRALTQNIGLLRTPHGYAVAPMHEGRVVAPDVFKALPEGLKAGVEAKLTAFENELSGVLDNRTDLQQDHRNRLRELDNEVASLTVRASLASLAKTVASLPAIAAWLESLTADLVRNAALFVAAHRKAGGHARAPIEIAQDPGLSRYRINLLTSAGAPVLIVPQDLERADLCGVVHLPPPGTALAPHAVTPGTLSSAGGGFLVIDAHELMSGFGAWPLIKQALASGQTSPLDATSAAARPSNVILPVDARLVVTGDLDDYRAFRSADRDTATKINFITAFDPTIPVSRETERDFAGLISAIIADESLQPVDGAAIAALMHDRTHIVSGTPVLETDLDPVRDVLVLANQNAKSNARAVTLAQDIIVALKQRADADEPFAPYPAAPIIPKVAK